VGEGRKEERRKGREGDGRGACAEWAERVRRMQLVPTKEPLPKMK